MRWVQTLGRWSYSSYRLVTFRAEKPDYLNTAFLLGTMGGVGGFIGGCMVVRDEHLLSPYENMVLGMGYTGLGSLFGFGVGAASVPLVLAWPVYLGGTALYLTYQAIKPHANPKMNAKSNPKMNSPAVNPKPAIPKAVTPKPVIPKAVISKSKEQVKIKDPRSLTLKLYHQTSEENAKKILKSQTMKPGRGGVVGPGIYFAVLPSDTNRKARLNGKLLQADVRLGSVYTTSRSEAVDQDALRQNGYSSVRWIGGTGDEFVVFDSSAISNIRLVG